MSTFQGSEGTQIRVQAADLQRGDVFVDGSAVQSAWRAGDWCGLRRCGVEAIVIEPDGRQQVFHFSPDDTRTVTRRTRSPMRAGEEG